MDAVTMGSTALTPSRTRKVGGHYFVSGNGLPWPSVEETQTPSSAGTRPPIPVDPLQSPSLSLSDKS
jgi:hypothetical protein